MTRVRMTRMTAWRNRKTARGAGGNVEEDKHKDEEEKNEGDEHEEE